MSKISNFLLNSDLHQIMDIYCPNDNYMILQWQFKDGRAEKTNENIKNVCLTSGIQTTTTGRLRLNEELQRLQNRLIYSDTDSVIFSSSLTDSYMPKLSNAIGGFTNELEDFRKENGMEPLKIKVDVDEYVYVTKCKGLQLMDETAKRINMQSMKSFLFGKNYTNLKLKRNETLFYTDKLQTKRQKISVSKNFKVITKEEYKFFQFTFDKRVVADDLVTYPYGYVRIYTKYLFNITKMRILIFSKIFFTRTNYWKFSSLYDIHV